MKTMELAAATGPLSQYARELDEEPLVLTDSGHPVAALMPISDVDLETVALASNPKFLAILETARGQRRAGQGLTPDEVRRELGLSDALQ
jgi:PHD/YefM family antitoxin component YafN of YafNO toxin-antitoxin module